MGRNKDQKARRMNAPGRRRNELREQRAADEGGDPAMENDCPKCGAKPGEVCVTPSGNPAAKTHAARG